MDEVPPLPLSPAVIRAFDMLMRMSFVEDVDPLEPAANDLGDGPETDVPW